jgi:hypothetical protein
MWPKSKSRGRPPKRFSRHGGIYRSDVSFHPVNPAQMPPPVGRLRCRAIARDGRSTLCPSSAMSSDRLFLDQVGCHPTRACLRFTGIFSIKLLPHRTERFIIER